MTDKLTDVIDEMVQNKTFSLDALDAIKDLKNRAVEREQHVEQMHAWLNSLTADMNRLGSENSVLRMKIEDQARRETSLCSREKKVLALELAEARSTATAEALREAFGVVFRNTTIRETVQRSTAVPTNVTPSGQPVYPSMVNEGSRVERTAE